MSLYTTWDTPDFADGPMVFLSQFEEDVVKNGVPPMNQHHNRKSHVNGHMDSWISCGA